jgi:hypothetical protein
VTGYQNETRGETKLGLLGHPQESQDWPEDGLISQNILSFVSPQVSFW